jgi:hypothetical protein
MLSSKNMLSADSMLYGNIILSADNMLSTDYMVDGTITVKRVNIRVWVGTRYRKKNNKIL